jgi:FtsP/CotA-like multicopper oxidase with cupredoxin domain
MNRRDVLRAGAAACTPSTFVAAPAGAATRRLRAAPAEVAAAGQGSLAVWAYDATVPGPLLRHPRGAELDVELDNALPDPTTIHWHGVRLPNPMDGVPHLTQPPVAPGERFLYRFALPDSGTYWYHPHLGTPEQVGRGLAGVLVVEDEDGPPVDREWIWVLGDWRLDGAGRIADDFYDYMDVSHAGRLGRHLTVNGQPAGEHRIEPGERVRLRLINAANARIFALRFDGTAPWLVALDGGPMDTARRLTGPLPLGPGMRADLIVDAAGEPGGQIRVIDLFGRGERTLATLRLDGARDRTRAERPAPRAPARNVVPEPQLADAQRQTLALGGGMMSMSGWPEDPLADRVARWARRLGGSREADPVWTVNGVAHMQHNADHPPEFSVARGRTVWITFENRSAFWHPMHLHGHSFRELRRNGRSVPTQAWRDTTLLAPRETVDVAFVADNPGEWLIHCHVLEHHAGGMGTRFRVHD